MKIVDERGVNFIVNSDLTFKRIKFDSIILDENEDIGSEEFDKRLEADFFLMSKTLSNSINDIKNVLEKIT
ncbi:hypothetical protein B6D12_06690 [Gilliamella apicola]|nr:hypothetical protein B6D12_06690 [Gilliamella apicola]